MREIFQNSLLVESVEVAAGFSCVEFLNQYLRNSFKTFIAKQLLFFSSNQLEYFYFESLLQ